MNRVIKLNKYKDTYISVSFKNEEIITYIGILNGIDANQEKLDDNHIHLNHSSNINKKLPSLIFNDTISFFKFLKENKAELTGEVISDILNYGKR